MYIYLIPVFAVASLLIATFSDIKKKDSNKLSKWGVIFIILAFGTLVGAWYSIESQAKEFRIVINNFNEIMQKVEKEALRLDVSDFQIRLTSQLKNTRKEIDLSNLPSIHTIGVIDSAEFCCELTTVNSDEKLGFGRWSPGYDSRLHGLGNSKNFIVRLYAKNITFGGLEYYPYLESINGKEFKMHVKLDHNIFKIEGWQHTIDLYISGRRFTGELDSTGFVTIQLKI